MKPPSAITSVLPSALASIYDWSVGSQQVSRRNAMVACTALAQRRAEREEVQEFLASQVKPELLAYHASP
jgi:hypothetical protein